MNYPICDWWGNVITGGGHYILGRMWFFLGKLNKDSRIITLSRKEKRHSVVWGKDRSFFTPMSRKWNMSICTGASIPRAGLTQPWADCTSLCLAPPALSQAYKSHFYFWGGRYFSIPQSILHPCWPGGLGSPSYLLRFQLLLSIALRLQLHNSWIVCSTTTGKCHID